MKRLIPILTFVFLLISAGAVYSQSLAELAKKEKLRREQVKAQERVITNQDPSKFKPGTVTTMAAPAEPAAQKAAPEKAAPQKEAAANPAKPVSDEPTDFQGRPESFWRQTLADARKKIRDLENEANVIILKIAGLQNGFYRESDGFKQQQIQREISKAIFEQDLNKEKLSAAKADLDDLLKDARKSGALPGWMEDKPAKP